MNKIGIKRIIASFSVILMFICSIQVIHPTDAADTSQNDLRASGIIWIAGDSMAADHSGSASEYLVPLCGWGVKLQRYFTDDVIVNNMAIGGTSSRSYTTTSNYETIMENIGEGDYLFIQFGHNDTKAGDRATDPYGSSDTEGSFKYYIKYYYIEPALEAGAVPVIMSSVVKYQYNANILRSDQTHRPFADAMRELAEEYRAVGKEICFIDMYSITEDLYNTLGPEGTRDYHGTELDGTENSTHYSDNGADKIADIIVKNLYLMKTDINRFILQVEYDDGDGSKEHPYLISNEMQLYALMMSYKNTKDSYIQITRDIIPVIQKQNKDINLYANVDGASYKYYNPVGKRKTCVIDNNYGTISNMNIVYDLYNNETDFSQSLFVGNNYGVIEQVNVDGIYRNTYTPSNLEDIYYFGGLATNNKEGATIRQCNMNIAISITSTGAPIVGGGVTAMNQGNISDCISEKSIFLEEYVDIYEVEDEFKVEDAVCIVGGIAGLKTDSGVLTQCQADLSNVNGYIEIPCNRSLLLLNDTNPLTWEEAQTRFVEENPQPDQSEQPQASLVPQESEQPQASQVPQESEQSQNSLMPRESELPQTSQIPRESLSPDINAGDVDKNGKVELFDAQMALKAALKIIALKEDEITIADVDRNQTIDLTDAQLILKYALKIITHF